MLVAHVLILDTFAKHLHKVTLSLVMSVRPYPQNSATSTERIFTRVRIVPEDP